MTKEFESKEDIVDFWDDADVKERRATLLDSYYTHLTVDRIQSVADLDPDSRVLEVGCGWGRLASHFQNNWEVVGMDITESLLRAQTEIAPNVTQIQGDAEHLPFTVNAFDAVYASRVLHYFDDLEPFLSEFARVAKPGGKVIVNQPNKFNPYYQFKYYTRLLSPFEVDEAFRRVGLHDPETIHFGFSMPGAPIPAFEALAGVPLLRRVSGHFLIHATA